MNKLSINDRSPCVIGVARHTWHASDDALAPEPIDMWELIAREAARDASAARDPLQRVDDLSTVHCQSWQYDDPTARLSARLALAPGQRSTSILAGTSPQRLINAAAERMLRGETKVALVVGGEALATKARLHRAGELPNWSAPHPNPSALPFDLDEWILPTELAHGILPAWLTFALLDQARRREQGTDLSTYRQRLGQVLARCNAVAARNPDAWFGQLRSASDIVTPSEGNRMIAEPYTKLMTAFMDVDMAAGVLLATHGEANALGVPQERRVYLRGWSFARDATHIAARHDLGKSQAMRVGAHTALRSAGLGVDDVGAFDLYSCFAAALGFATDALGLAHNDSRPITVTGGLPYHGGPSSNYMSHSIGYLVDRLRSQPGEVGLVSGIGMHMTKHVFACYSTQPGPVHEPDYVAIQNEVDRRQPDVPIAATATGPATIVTSTTVYGREGTPNALVAICELPDGQRAYARTTDVDVVNASATEDWIGQRVELVTGNDGTNVLQAVHTSHQSSVPTSLVGLRP